jgi:hypothetical protein
MKIDMLMWHGVIVFARGFAVNAENTSNIKPDELEHWIRSGLLVREFNDFVKGDNRIDVVVLPFFDGISEITLK